MPSAPGNYNAWSWGGNQGKIIWDDVQGGVMLLNPATRGSVPTAGAIDFQTMQAKIWHLLREPGPDTGFPPPVTGDFPQQVVQRDLNIMLGQFVSATGLAPMLSDRMVTVPVYAVLDYPVPPDLQSLTRVEYTPAGQQTYTLLGKSFSEFDAYWQNVTQAMGQPYCYRELWAGYIRLFPQPGPGNQEGPGIGTITFTGVITAGNTVQVTLTNVPAAPVVVPTYVVQAGDSPSSIADAVSTLINKSNAVIGPAEFLATTQTADNQIQLTAANAPGTNITYDVTLNTGATLVVTPNGIVNLSPNGDTMNFYYSSTGSTMAHPSDTPGIPPQFHIALVYGVLADYWLRKQDPDGLAKVFAIRFAECVKQAKQLEWDSKRDVNPTSGAFYDSDLDSGTWL